MRSSGETVLTGKTNADEFTIGGLGKGIKGRSDLCKNKVLIPIEVRGRKKSAISV